MSTARKRVREVAEEGVHLVKVAEEKIERALTCMWDELPSWQQDNHFIHSGYRHATNSFRLCFSSLFYLHNETINIYTHLVGALFFLLLSIYLHRTLLPRYPLATRTDLLSFSLFFLGCTTCLTLSSLYHTISNHSLPVATFGNRLDYLGIVFMIAGSYLSILQYGFQCHPHLDEMYSLMIISLGIVCAVLTMHPHFRSPEYRPIRAAMYVLYGLSGVIPILHGAKVMGWEGMVRQVSFWWMVTEGVFYISGAVIYAVRVPERWWPGKCDLVGASHQIFHVLVVMAAGAHLVGLIKAFDYWHTELGLQCPNP